MIEQRGRENEMEKMMLFPTLTLLILVSSADQLNMASAFRLFDELDITITEANTTWMSFSDAST